MDSLSRRDAQLDERGEENRQRHNSLISLKSSLSPILEQIKGTLSLDTITTIGNIIQALEIKDLQLANEIKAKESEEYNLKSITFIKYWKRFH